MTAHVEDMGIKMKVEIEDPLLEHQDTYPHFEHIEIKDEFAICEDQAYYQQFMKCELVSTEIQNGGPNGTSEDQNQMSEPETNTKINNGHKCTICKKEFSYKSKLQTHIQIHSGVRRFQCTICNKQFTYKVNLTTHMKIHSGERNFNCPICKKIFLLKTNLVPHLKTHIGTKDFKCTICNKDFLHKSYLNRHMIFHKGERKFNCSVCNKKFLLRSQLVPHMKTHTGIREFKCTICNKEFVHKSHLNRHMKLHEPVEKIGDPDDPRFTELQIEVNNITPMMTLLDKQDTEQHFVKSDMEIKDEFTACEAKIDQSFYQKHVKCESVMNVI